MPSDTNMGLNFEILFVLLDFKLLYCFGMQKLQSGYPCCHCDGAFYVCDSAIPGKAQLVVTRKTSSEK